MAWISLMCSWSWLVNDAHRGEQAQIFFDFSVGQGRIPRAWFEIEGGATL